MNRLIDLELKSETVWISCPFDAQIVGTIKTIPGREFDKRTRRWSIPLEHVAVAIQRLDALHFRFTPRMRDWWAEHREQLEVAPAEPVFEVDPEDGYTVSRLNAEARQVLTGHFGEVWIVAEIDGFARNKPGGHAYFELVERAGSEPIARIRAVMFAKTRERIEAALPEDLPLRDGLRVRFQGKVELYAANGSYQFLIEGVDVDWAIGARRRKRDQVLERLESEGIAQQNLELPLPLLPLRIGLITAASSDAYNDFVHELERSGLGFEVFVHDARMQGRDAEASVLTALSALVGLGGLDVIVVTRGGGSQGDLATFDSYAIGAAVCRCAVKVIAGIGHHRDRSVLDFVATSEKTPTAAAQALVGRVREAVQRVDAAAGTVADSATRRLETARLRVDRLGASCDRGVSRRLRVCERTLDHLANSVQRASTDRVEIARRQVGQSAHRMQRATERRTDGARRDLERFEVRLAERSLRSVERSRALVVRHCETLRRAAPRSASDMALRMEQVEATLRLADPRRVIERGYALLRDDNGKIVMTAAELRRLGRARLELRDETVEVQPMESKDD